MDPAKVLHALTFYISTTISILQFLLKSLLTLNKVPVVFTIIDTLISLWFRSCGMSPYTIDLDDQTTVHFWTTNHRKFDKPNLVMVHGFGGDARWQFIYQVRALSHKFNLYVPDLIFFGRSKSTRLDRTDRFQAKCLAEGMKRLGVDRFSVYSISYGGYVAYRMAEICLDEIEKVVIVSSGVMCSDDQKRELVLKFGRDVKDMLLPLNAKHLRFFVNTASFTRPLRWLPDFFLQDFINVMGNNNRKEKLELVECLMSKKAETDLPILVQGTLLIWGDQDKIFPLELAYHLHTHLGPTSKLEILKNTGHAANIDSPDALNNLIISFVLGHS